MYFTELTVENIRCFGPEQTLKLTDADGKPAMWTVILGENGTGKTTLLQSIIFNRLQHTMHLLMAIEKVSEGREYNINSKAKKYLKNKEKHLAPIIRDMISKDIVQNIVIMGFENTKESDCAVSLEYYSSSSKLFRVTVFTESNLYRINMKDFDVESPENMVLLGYGAARRSAKADDDTYIPTCNSLFSYDSSLRSSKNWLSQTHHAALMAGDRDAPAKRRLAQVKDLLTAVLPDVLGIDLVATDEPIPKIKVLFKTDYGLVELEQLSHGYQTMIAWMVDFASRLVEAYPDSPNPLAEPAVCLVDEIDLHLHPRWQREIMSYLSNLFPKTQFIVTAHSPLIVQSAENANVVLLRKEGDHVVIENDKNVVRGWRVDQILTSDLFGLESARPPEYTKLMEERRKLLEKSRLTKKDKARLAELDAALDAMPTGESAADREAMDIIRRAAARLKAEEDKGGAV